MKLFYRLVLLNLVLTFPVVLSLLRDIANKTQTLSNQAILLMEFGLCFLDFAITWKLVRQGRIARRFNIWMAWVAGPFFAVIVAFAIAALIIKPTFGRFFWSFLYLYWATSAWVTVRRSQESQVPLENQVP